MSGIKIVADIRGGFTYGERAQLNMTGRVYMFGRDWRRELLRITLASSRETSPDKIYEVLISATSPLTDDFRQRTGRPYHAELIIAAREYWRRRERQSLARRVCIVGSVLPDHDLVPYVCMYMGARDNAIEHLLRA
jgi:hypothetical protein